MLDMYVAGAVYSPAAVTVPIPAGITVQVTCPDVSAVNCWACDGPSVVTAGLTCARKVTAVQRRSIDNK